MSTADPADDPLRDDRRLDAWVARLGEELADLEAEASAAAGAEGERRAACRSRIADTAASLRTDYHAAIAGRPRRPLGHSGLAGYRRWRHGRRMMRFRAVVSHALAELERLDAALADDRAAVGAAGPLGLG